MPLAFPLQRCLLRGPSQLVLVCPPPASTNLLESSLPGSAQNCPRANPSLRWWFRYPCNSPLPRAAMVQVVFLLQLPLPIRLLPITELVVLLIRRCFQQAPECYRLRAAVNSYWLWALRHLVHKTFMLKGRNCRLMGRHGQWEAFHCRHTRTAWSEQIRGFQYLWLSSLCCTG